MNEEQRQYVLNFIQRNNGCISDDYINHISYEILDRVCEDIEETADTDFSDGDIKLAVGRVIIDLLENQAQ